MTTFTEPTGEAWIRTVNKRLAILERLPRSTGTAATTDIAGGTSVAFEADALMTSGVNSDPSLNERTPGFQKTYDFHAFTTVPEVMEWSGVESVEAQPTSIDGGAADSAYTATLDGGAADSTYTTTFDGGHA